jgi:methyltransferase family protein
MIRNLLKRIPRARRLARLVGLVPQQSSHREFLLKMFPKNSVCAEIGVHKGDFSAQILRTVDPEELHLVDPWRYEASDTYKEAWYGGKTKGGQSEMDERYQAVLLRFESDIRSGRVRIHRGYSSDVLDEFPDDYFDWVYIDGNHLYEFIKQDLELSFKKTKPCGYITGDDYHEGGWWQGGVKKAVDEFFREKPVQLITIRNGQFVLRK